MKAEELTAAIAVIGTELTLGRSSESNSEYLGRWFSKNGYQVRLVSKLPDDARIVARELQHLACFSDVVLITGGLGATHDDITRDALADFLGKPLKLNKSLESVIAPLAPPEADFNNFIKQAYLPEGAAFIEASSGTAPGIVAAYDGKVVYALPGVPSEMKAMLDEVAKDLKSRFGLQSGTISRLVKVAGAPEPVVAELIDPIIKRYPQLIINILAGIEDIKVTVIAEAGLQDKIDMAVAGLKERLGRYAYGGENDTISSVVGGLLLQRRLTVGTAESLTAGQISGRISATAGSSRYFKGGIAAYDNSVKEDLLKVSREMISVKGAVSSEVAAAMAEGARKALKVDIGLSVTGIAGPDGGTAGKPVGLVFAGIAHKGGTEVKELMFKGDRRSIQCKTAVAALNMLRLHLLDGFA